MNEGKKKQQKKISDLQNVMDAQNVKNIWSLFCF